MKLEDKYGQVEKILKKYKMLKIHIENTQRKIDYLCDCDGITGISCEGIGGGSGGNKSVTERTALKNMEDAEKLIDDLKRSKLAMAAIDRAVDELKEHPRSIIRGYYFEGLPWFKVAYSVGYGERHCRKIRNEAVNELIPAFLGDI